MSRALLTIACSCLLATASATTAQELAPSPPQEGLRLTTQDLAGMAGPSDRLELRPAMIDPLRTASLPIRRPERVRAIAAVPPAPLQGTGGLGNVSADLLEAIEIAIEESDLVQSVSAERRAAQAGVRRAGAAFLPIVSGNARIGSDADDNPSLSDPGMTAGLSIGLPLLDGGQRIHAKRSAESRALAAAAEVRSVVESVALETINAGIDLNLATRQAKVLEDNLRDLGELRKAVRGRVEAGRASEGDVADLEAELNEVSRTLVMASSSAEKSRAILSAQLRQAAPGGFELPDIEAVPRKGLEALVTLTRSRNSGLEANWHRYDAAQSGRKAARGRYLPQLNLKADYNASRNETSRTSDGWNIGLQLSVPLVDMATMADVREAGELADAAMYRAMSEDRKAETQLRIDWIEYQSAGRQADLTRRKIGALRKSYAAKVDQYHAGLIPMDDVLMTRRQLALSTSEELEAVVTRFAAITRLAATSGLLADIVGTRAARSSGRASRTSPGSMAAR